MSDYIKKYNPNRSADWNYGGEKWRLSRSKIDLFIECPKCFYLDNKLGTKRPSMPAFNLNIAVDELFKKEFDVHRQAGTVHPIMEKYGIEAIPFRHLELDTWRDPFVGVEFRHQDTELLVSGGLDDVWVKDDGTLIIVDYKSTSKDGEIISLADSPWEKQYARQIGVYRWLLLNNGFQVDEVGYFLYANALKTPAGFNNELKFETTLVPTKGDLTWIEPTLKEIKNCLESPMYPDSASTCEYCPYREACGKKLLSIARQTKK